MCLVISYGYVLDSFLVIERAIPAKGRALTARTMDAAFLSYALLAPSRVGLMQSKWYGNMTIMTWGFACKAY